MDSILKRRVLFSQVGLFVAGIVFATVFQPWAALQSFAQPGCRTFSETKKTVCGRFLQYWQTNGGLAQQGFPISEEFTEVSDLDGKRYTVQYFERAVFERHPENQPPYDVLLSQLGTFRFREKYRGVEPGAATPVPNPPTPVPPVPTPAPAPIRGQVIDLENRAGTSKLRVRVTDVTETRRIESADNHPAVTANGKFVVVFLTVNNIGTQSDEVDSDSLQLKDSRGRLFGIAGLQVHFTATAFYKRSIYYQKVEPNTSEDIVLVFDVPTDAAGYELVRYR